MRNQLQLRLGFEIFIFFGQFVGVRHVGRPFHNHDYNATDGNRPHKKPYAEKYAKALIDDFLLCRVYGFIVEVYIEYYCAGNRSDYRKNNG